MQARYPKLAEIFNGREDLAERVRTFWDDGADETCFTEMQILAHYAGALTGPTRRAVGRLESAVPTVPLDLDLPSETPEDRALRRTLPPAQGIARAAAGVSRPPREVWAPVDEMWQQSLPIIEEAGRHVVAQYERGRSLESLYRRAVTSSTRASPTSARRRGRAAGGVRPVPVLRIEHVPRLPRPGADRRRRRPERRRGAGPDRVGGPPAEGVADPTRLAILHSLATAPSTVGELACSSASPSRRSACT